jgi:hypothetical protein
LGCEQLLLEGVTDSRLLVTREGNYIMEHVLCEPVELTEFELDAVAGGDPFGSATGNTTNSGVFSGNFFNANAVGAGSEAEVTTVNIILSPSNNFLNG